MKAYLIPFRFDRRIAVGSPDGWKIEGPILYAPNKGAIFYTAGIHGDAEGMGFVTNGVDYFDHSEIILSQLERQIRGEEPQFGLWKGSKFDLSEGVVEVEISDLEIDAIATKAKEAYDALGMFRNQSMKLAFDLEGRVGREKIYQRLE